MHSFGVFIHSICYISTVQLLSSTKRGDITFGSIHLYVSLQELAGFIKQTFTVSGQKYVCRIKSQKVMDLVVSILPFVCSVLVELLGL